jgi:cytochrome c
VKIIESSDTDESERAVNSGVPHQGGKYQESIEMSKLVAMMLFAISVAVMSTPAVSAERASIEEAKALVKKARVYIREHGTEKAFAEISNPKGQFIDRDLYVYVYDKNMVSVAHGVNPRFIGKNMSELRDTDGVYITKGLLEAAKKGGGTVKFKFMDPMTKTVEPKIGYAELEGDYLVGSGAYDKR